MHGLIPTKRMRPGPVVSRHDCGALTSTGRGTRKSAFGVRETHCIWTDPIVRRSVLSGALLEVWNAAGGTPRSGRVRVTPLKRLRGPSTRDDVRVQPGRLDRWLPVAEAGRGMPILRTRSE